MKNFLNSYNNFYLVGIKGVGMTSLAQCLVDAGKKVSGCDVREDFVSKKHLDRLKIEIDTGFDTPIPPGTDCVIFTAAHQGKYNPQVVDATEKNISTYSHAEALGMLANQKKSIAVCGVGGKSSVSAMITWILEHSGTKPSFSVGVGDIIGLNKTGQWITNSEYFVAEADEYVVNPKAAETGVEITPRFSFLKPFITVCTNLKFDHPDVYKDFAHTKKVFNHFFGQIQDEGYLIINADNQDLVELAKKHNRLKIISFGNSDEADFQLTHYKAYEGKTMGTFQFAKRSYQLTLQVPGKFNILNAMAAIAAAYVAGIEINDSIKSLTDFASTMRRFEFVGEKNGVKYYDDYAHHPNEIMATIKALNEWYPKNHKIIAFQPHTFSRTKKLFKEFIDAFNDSKEVVMLDIFPSARESFDSSVSSDLLCEAINKMHSNIKATNLKTHQEMAKYLKENLRPASVCITLGAGDINKVHDLIK